MPIYYSCTFPHTGIYDSNYFSQFLESHFELRCKSKHLDHCNLLETYTEDRQHYSLVYGVNRRALLSSLRFFDVASGALIPDIMHDILEGALPLVVKQMLKVFVTEKKMFSLDFIDESVSRLNIQPCDGDRPSCLRGISLQSSDSNLHQHGWQCLCMLY
jgi:hypothetical protein